MFKLNNTTSLKLYINIYIYIYNSSVSVLYINKDFSCMTVNSSVFTL